jgi:hypothetical protein
LVWAHALVELDEVGRERGDHDGASRQMGVAFRGEVGHEAVAFGHEGAGLGVEGRLPARIPSQVAVADSSASMASSSMSSDRRCAS